MFSKIIRIALSLGLFVWSIYNFIDGEIENGIALLFPTTLVFFILRNERILWSLYHMRKQNLDKAEKFY